MATIGTLRLVKGRDGEHFEGQVSTLSLSVTLLAYPNRSKRYDNDPDYEFVAINPNGEPIRIGAGWEKTVKAAGREGEKFISITLDDPSFPAPLNIAAFKADEPDIWNLSWRRRQDRAGKAA